MVPTGSGKQEKQAEIMVREKSGNFILGKVREKSGNLKKKRLP